MMPRGLNPCPVARRESDAFPVAIGGEPFAASAGKSALDRETIADAATADAWPSRLSDADRSPPSAFPSSFCTARRPSPSVAAICASDRASVSVSFIRLRGKRDFRGRILKHVQSKGPVAPDVLGLRRDDVGERERHSIRGRRREQIAKDRRQRKLVGFKIGVDLRHSIRRADREMAADDILGRLRFELGGVEAPRLIFDICLDLQAGLPLPAKERQSRGRQELLRRRARGLHLAREEEGLLEFRRPVDLGLQRRRLDRGRRVEPAGRAAGADRDGARRSGSCGRQPRFREEKSNELVAVSAGERQLPRELACPPFRECALQLNPAIEADRPQSPAQLRRRAARLPIRAVIHREFDRGEVFRTASGNAVGIVARQRHSPQNGLRRVRLKAAVEPALPHAPHGHNALAAQRQSIGGLRAEFRDCEEILIVLQLDRDSLRFDQARPKAARGDIDIGRFEVRGLVPQKRRELRKPSLPGRLYAFARQSVGASLASFQAGQIETVASKRNLQLPRRGLIEAQTRRERSAVQFALDVRESRDVVRKRQQAARRENSRRSGFRICGGGRDPAVKAAQIFAVDCDTRHQFRFAGGLFERACEPDRGFARKRRPGVLEQPSLSRPLTLRFRPLDEFASELDLIARQRKMDSETRGRTKATVQVRFGEHPSRQARPAPLIRLRPTGGGRRPESALAA